MNHFMHPHAVHRLFRPLAEKAVEAGWSLRKTKNNHIQWLGPEGARVYSASTPSDYRAVLNIRSELRKRGLRI